MSSKSKGHTRFFPKRLILDILTLVFLDNALMLSTENKYNRFLVYIHFFLSPIKKLVKSTGCLETGKLIF